MLVYLVTDLKRKRSRTVAMLDDAAEIIGIDRDDIEWWPEECGIYEGVRWSVVVMMMIRFAEALTHQRLL